MSAVAQKRDVHGRDIVIAGQVHRPATQGHLSK